MEFYEKLSAYTKSRIKTVEKKRNLVQDIADYLIALDQQLCLLPTRSTLAYKLQQRRICVYTTDVLCCLLEAQDYGGIQLLIANDCCTYVEVVMVCALYHPERVKHLLDSCVDIKSNISANIQEWKEESRKQQVPTLLQLLEEQELQVLRDQMQSLGLTKQQLELLVKSM